MSDVTFTPEQIREIRRRIEDACAHKQHILDAFPLPKVTRHRTFTVQWRFGRRVETYRVRWNVVEFLHTDGHWERTNSGDGTVPSFAAELAREMCWSALAAFADVCARPTEEVAA